MVERNPWHGINAWREFKYDLRHPVKFVRGGLANVNNVSSDQRRIGAAVAVVGLLNVAAGLGMLVRGYFF